MAYCSRAEVRALDSLADETIFSDAAIDEAIAYATDLVDTETGTSWEAKAQTLTLDGAGGSRIFTRVPNLRSVTACTIDGVAVSDLSGWRVLPDGLVIADNAYFTAGWRNVSLTVTAGATTTVPPRIAWACRTIARHYLLDLVSRVPDGALNVQTEFGLVQLAQPGKHGPTPIPQVNEILRKHSHRAPRVG